MSHDIKRLLRLLGITEQRPSIDALTELVTAFMMRVPFENVSKLYYLKRNGLRGLPDFETYVGGIEQFNFGGTCYANNYYLNMLLVHLGYDVMLCGADMNNPDVHLVNIVKIDGREFLVDAGYAAPFMKPLPRDLDHDYAVSLGRDRYVLKPQDEKGKSRVEQYRDGQLRHGYVAKPIPRSIEHFSEVIRDSFQDSSTFMNALLLVRWFPNRSMAIYNLSIIESEGPECTVHRLASRDELPGAVEVRFGVPKEITAEAVSLIGEFRDTAD